jgi:hypothetical protein
MIVQRICFEQLYPTGEFANQRLRVEGTLMEGESITEAFNHAKAMVDAAFKTINPNVISSNQPPEPLPETHIQKQHKEEREKIMLDGINACTTIPKPDGLESFWLGVQQSGNKQIMDAYLLKLKELQ